MGREHAEALDRAALLCKADLTTEMVAELPSLQGVMGREYARHSGEDQLVWEAIGEHYQPRSAQDTVPVTGLGLALALADKIDTIASCFAVGVVPSGSADPLGLRREAIGIIRMLADRPSLGVASVSDLVARCLSVLSPQVGLERPASAVTAEVMTFLGERLGIYLRESEGVRYDLVQAAMAVGYDDVPRTVLRARALQRLADSCADFLPVVVACTRPINIAKDFPGGEVDPALFQHQAEDALWEAYQDVLREAEKANPMELFRLFERLRAPIDRYFDEVLVMAENEKIRNNRLAMCWQLSQLFRRLADFTLVVQA
jgi:glycyl-tRNA synthetase beta chain